MFRYLNFASLDEFYNRALKESASAIKLSRSDDPKQLQWSGGATWEEAKRLARYGWLDMAKEMEKYKASILPIITDKVLRPVPCYSVAGYSIDVGVYRSNDPECFFSKIYEEKNYPGKIYKMVCSIAYSAAIKPETIKQRGAIICALIDAIEYAGHRVEVVCNWAVTKDKGIEFRKGFSKGKGRMEVDILVKPSNAHFEVNDMAFVLCHPAMLRRMVFSVAEEEGWADFTGLYGYPAEAKQKGDIYLEGIFSDEVSDNKAIEWVIGELKKAGVNVEIE